MGGIILKTNQLVCTSVFLLILFVSVLVADDKQSIEKQEDVVVAAVPRHWPPQYIFDDKKGTPSGFAVDVFDKVAEQTGILVRYKVYDTWPLIHDALKRKEADLVPNMGITSERLNLYDFTSPLETFDIALFVRSKSMDIHGPEDLKDRKVGAVMANKGLFLVRERNIGSLVVYASVEAAFMALVSGNVDALVYPAPIILKMAQEAGLEKAVKITGEPLMEIRRAIAVRKGKQKLVDTLNASVRAFVMSPEYKEIYRKWYGDIKSNYWTGMKVAGLAGAILLVTFLVMFFWRYLSIARLNRTLIALMAEREKAEETLRLSEQKFLKVFRNAPCLMSIISIEDGRYYDVNDVFVKTIGRDREEVLGRTSIELGIITAENREGLLNLINSYGHIRGHELELICADGSRLRCLYSGEVFEIDGKKQLLAVANDITERSLMERALVESERKWRNILVNTPQIGVSLDPQARIVFVNNHFLRLTGWKEEEILDRNWFEMFIPENIKEKIRDVFAQTMKRKDTLGYSSFENEIVTRSGELKTIAWSNVLTKGSDGYVTDVTCLGVDLTERRHAEQAMHDRERKYRLLFEESNDGILLYTVDGIILEVNSRAAELLGYHCRELENQPLSRVYRTRDDAFLEKIVKEVNEKGQLRFESVMVRKDTTRLQVDVSARVVDRKSGMVQAIIRDITERKRLERQLQQAQRMESIGRLAGGVAHDLNNLLAPILGYGEILQEEISESDPRRESVDQIVFAGSRAADLVRQLLAFGRKQMLEKKEVSLNTIVKSFEKLLRRTIREDIRIEVSLADDLPVVRADISQLEQVMMNLAVNAQDAMGEGGLLKIETRVVEYQNRVIRELQTIEPGSYVVLSVEDNGHGMDEDTCRMIFEPFFTTKDIHKGTGLGLSTVYGIVRQHNGAVEVESALGKGSRFNVILPVAEAAEPRTAAVNDISPESAAGGDETILLVEDNAQLMSMACAILERNGYTVWTAGSGNEALSLLRSCSQTIHLLLTDVVMPDMNGNQLAEKITALFPDIRVLYMSGYPDEIITDQGRMSAERFHYLQKPFSASKLLVEVRKALQRL